MRKTQENIADYLYHHPDLSNTQKAKEIMEIVEAEGYCKPPDRPKLKEKIGNALQLICWNLVSDNINCSGVECNEGKGSNELCPGLKEHQEQILALIPEPSDRPKLRKDIDTILNKLISITCEIAGFREFTPAKMSIMVKEKTKANFRILALLPEPSEGQPPLLSEREMKNKWGRQYIDHQIMSDAIAKAQYNSIMEHLGLPFRV